MFAMFSNVLLLCSFNIFYCNHIRSINIMYIRQLFIKLCSDHDFQYEEFISYCRILSQCTLYSSVRKIINEFQARFGRKHLYFFLYRLGCITFDILFETVLQMSSDYLLIYQTQSVFDGDQSDIKFISGYMMLTCNIITFFEQYLKHCLEHDQLYLINNLNCHLKIVIPIHVYFYCSEYTTVC